MRMGFYRMVLVFSMLAIAAGAPAGQKLLKLVPNPREISFQKGETRLNPKWRIWPATGGEDDLHTARMLAEEAKKGFGWSWEMVDRDPGKNVVIIKKVEAKTDDPELYIEQGYTLTIEKDRITIEAPSPTGRFYGAQTLRQIFRNNVSLYIPRLVIRDYPSIKWRGLSDDISRGQVSRVDNFEQIIRQLAFYKINLYQPYIEDMFRFDADPRIGKERGAITKTEMARMAREARKNHVVLQPVLECLGHQDRLLSLPENRKFAEIQDPEKDPWSFSPVSEEAFQFVAALIDEMAAATSSPFFHIGGDESWDVGKGTSKKQVEKLGIGRVHAEYFARLNTHITEKHGRRMMLYADMINRHPEAMEYLPRDCILVDWHYSTKSDFATVGKLKKAGFENVFTSPGIWSWANYYPCHRRGMINVAKAAEVAREENLEGCITSSWGDRGAENLRENNWLGYAFSSAAQWETGSPSIDSFHRRFVAVQFGVDSPNLADAISRLDWTPFIDANYLATFFHRIPKIKPREKEWLESLDAFRKNLENVHETVDQVRPKMKYRREYADIIHHVVRRHLYLVEREKAIHRIASLLGEKKSGDLPVEKQEEMIRLLENLRNQLVEIAGEFPGLWLRYYKYPMLDFNMERLHEQIATIQGYITSARAGDLAAVMPPSGVWFWYPDENPRKEASRGKRYFVRLFDLEGQRATSAQLRAWADDKAVFYLNGERLFDVGYHDKPETREVSSLLRKKYNILAVTGENRHGAAGILVELKIGFKDRKALLITGDEQWKTTDNLYKKWKETKPKGKKWKDVKLLGQGLIKPWDDIDW